MVEQGKHNILGVYIDAIDCEAAVERIIDAAKNRASMAVSALAVHGVMTGLHDCSEWLQSLDTLVRLITERS